jgi:hypothetical protein
MALHPRLRKRAPRLRIVSSYTYEDVPEGTRVRLRFTWGKSRHEREESTAVNEFLTDVVGRGQAALSVLFAEEMARRATLAAEAPAEPAAPKSRDRECGSRCGFGL